jgi:hypothetical protein
MTNPDYVTTTLDQADKVRAEIIGSAARSYQLVTGALNSAAKQAQPDLQALVDVSFGTVEKVVARGRSFADSLVAATTRVGV